MSRRETTNRAEGLVRSFVLRAKVWSEEARRARAAVAKESEQPGVYRNPRRLERHTHDLQSARGRRKMAMQMARDTKEAFGLPPWLCEAKGAA